MNRKDRILPIIKSLLAEFAGTFTLVILSCGTATAGGSLGEISLAFTFAVASSVAFSAHASGGHLNPAVTMGFLATGRLHPARAAAYIVVQCLGGIAAAGTLYGISPVAFVKRGLGATTLHTDIDPFQGTVIETIITFVLLVVVFSVCDTHRMDIGGSGPLTIGISVGACHLFAVNYTGAGMNPARSLGPAVMSGRWRDHWVYWVGPFLGTFIASVLYKFFLCAIPVNTEANQTMKLRELKKLSDKEAPEEGISNL